jgi:hypothetical protein
MSDMLEKIKRRVKLLDKKASKKPVKKVVKKPVKKPVKKVKIVDEITIMPVGDTSENIKIVDELPEMETMGGSMSGTALKVLIGLMTPIIQYELTKLYKNMRDKKNI